MNLIEKIDAIEGEIFDYKVGGVTNSVVDIFSTVLESKAILTEDQAVLNRLNGTMGKCLSAMRDKDYLMLADQLEYELKPMIIANSK